MWLVRCPWCSPSEGWLLWWADSRPTIIKPFKNAISATFFKAALFSEKVSSFEYCYAIFKRRQKFFNKIRGRPRKWPFLSLFC
jgi:hypothetical protein